MSSENEEIIRRTYQYAEDKDIDAFIGCFTDDGTFTDQSIGVTYRAGGWTTEGPLGGGASLLARDPDGNLLEFVENS